MRDDQFKIKVMQELRPLKMSDSDSEKVIAELDILSDLIIDYYLEEINQKEKK